MLPQSTCSLFEVMACCCILQNVKFSSISDISSMTGHQKKNIQFFHSSLNTQHSLFTVFVFGWLFFKVGLNVQCGKSEIKSDDVFIGNIGETSSELTQDQDQNEYDLIITKFDNIQQFEQVRWAGLRCLRGCTWPPGHSLVSLSIVKTHQTERQVPADVHLNILYCMC